MLFSRYSALICWSPSKLRSQSRDVTTARGFRECWALGDTGPLNLICYYYNICGGIKMDKFLTWDFAGLLVVFFVLLIAHEFGHYLAYRMLGYDAVVRKSIFIPGIDPKNTIQVTKTEGLIIALGGFAFSTIIIVLPCMLIHYHLWFVLLIGSIAGSIVDFIWALTMIFTKNITIYSK